MIDIKWIRENPAQLDESLKRRHQTPQSHEILAIDTLRRQTQTRLQELQNERNRLAQEIGQAKRQGLESDELTRAATLVKEAMPALEREESEQAETLNHLLSALPNLLEDFVPEGHDESDNQLIHTWGTPASFDFTPLAHFELGEKLGLMDFETAAKMAGSRFVVLKGLLAQLERALGQFMIDLHTQEFGYLEVSPPLLVRDQAVYGTGQLPKFSDTMFETGFQTGNQRWLIPTSEVPLTNLVRESILEAQELPRRFTAYTPSFRSEAGAAGRDTRGMIRQHQFYKVELVSVVSPDQGPSEHQRMLKAAETVLQRLELPYRVMLLSSGDTGHHVRCTYDLEVWLPSENTYREISSCSYCGDYQARRMQAKFRYKNEAGKNVTEFVHTLNGSGVAVGRALIAVLENYQNEDGSIRIPNVLQPYMKGCTLIASHS